MKKKIVILGNLSEADLECIDTIARESSYEVDVVGGGELSTVDGVERIPAAYLSFQSCSPAAVIEQFGNLPVGTGEKTPFFQRVDGEVPLFARELPITGFFEVPLTGVVVRSIFRCIERNEALLKKQHEAIAQLSDSRNEMERFVEIGTALSYENNIKHLLQLILTECRKAVKADAGSIYVRERVAPGGSFTDSLLFMVAQNDSVDTGKGATYNLPINKESIAGYVAFTGKPLNIDDVAKIDSSLPFRTSSTFQGYFSYRAKSMLTIPLKNLEHDVVGVLQLINRKNDCTQLLENKEQIEKYVVPFTLSDETFVLSVASLAAVSIERAQLHENITALFEGFLNASIASIDERDRVTSGHSRRVMGYAMAFVDAAEKEPDHPFAELCRPPERRRQFQFAALLHDIGKIGVPEFILNKEQRLSNEERDILMAQIDYIALRRIIDPDSVSWKTAEELEADREFLLKINQAGRVSDEEKARLEALSLKTFTDLHGKNIPLLSAHHVESMTVKKGNLTVMERELINSHARSTFRILSKIPWTNALKDVPAIAAQHHEKINGSGYPDGISGDQMFLESKILAVIDIYEALVAQDRPYKPKMRPEKALAILDEEVKADHLDAEIVNFFKEKDIYKLFVHQDDEEQ